MTATELRAALIELEQSTAPENARLQILMSLVRELAARVERIDFASLADHHAEQNLEAAEEAL